MAISIIGTPQVGNTNNGGTVTLTFSTRPSEGDYTVAVIGSPAALGAIGTISTTGYAAVTGGTHTGAAAANPSLAIFWKKQGSTTDTTVAGTSGNDSDTDSSMIAFVLRGVDPTTFSDATPTTAGETTSTNPDPASITVGTTGACVIVAACMTVLKDTAITAPSGYIGYSQVGDDTYDHTLAAAYKLNCSGTEAPASWTDWGSGLWYAITIAVKPQTSFNVNVFDSVNVSEQDPPTVTKIMAPASALTDNFDDNSFDTAKWSEFEETWTADEANGEIEMTSTTAAGNISVYSPNYYNLTGDSFYLKLVDEGNIDLASYRLYFIAQLDDNNNIGFKLNGSGSKKIEAIKTVGSESVVGTGVTYNGTTHLWLRIRESGGTTYWDYSSDGSTWNNLTSTSNPIAVTSLRPVVNVFGNAELSTFVTKWDNFNVVGIITPSPNVYDTVNVSEGVTVLRTSHNINVFDSVNVSEDRTQGTTPKQLNVFDTVNVSETVTIIEKNLVLSVYDTVNVSENITSQASPQAMSVYDSVNVSEGVTTLEANLIVSVFDSVTVAENISTIQANYVPSVFSGVTVTENITAGTTPKIINVFDSIEVSEDVTGATTSPNNYSVNVSDNINVSEYVSQSKLMIWSGMGMQMFSTSDNLWYAEDSVFDQQVLTLIANGFTTIRLDLCTYDDTDAIARSKAAALRAMVAGLNVVWGIASDGDHILTSTTWPGFSTAVQSAATWAEANGIWEFQIGNEEEYHNDDDTLTDTQLIANLKSLATTVQGIFTSGNVSYSTSIDFVSNWQTAGKGDIDLLAWTVYTTGNSEPVPWENAIDEISSTWGASAYVSEFSPSWVNLADFSADEGLQADKVEEMIAYFIKSGIPRAYYFCFYDDSRPYGVQGFGAQKTDLSFRQLWYSLISLYTYLHDDIALSENFTTSQSGKEVAVYDSIQVSESITIIEAQLKINVVDSVEVSENTSSQVVQYIVNVSDSIEVSDNLTTFTDLLVDLFDSIEAGESITSGISTNNIGLVISDDVQISENITTGVDFFLVNVIDNIKVSENLNVRKSVLDINVHDLIGPYPMVYDEKGRPYLKISRDFYLRM